MVQVTYEMCLTNFGDLDMLWGQARDFVKNRTYDEMQQIDNYFNECYSDNDLSLTELNDILSYDSDYLLEEVLGYIKNQNDELCTPDSLVNINDDTITYAQFEQVIFNSQEVMDYISDKTKDYILNCDMDGIAAEEEYFTKWIEKIQEKTDLDSDIYSDLEELSTISFDSENWTFND